jgi:acyl dehydratase
MLDKTLIGRESEPAVIEVEKGAIRRFAEALGDANPLALDEAAAQAAGYPSLVAPPTFAVTLGWSERFRHSLDLGTRAVLHGEQAFEYARPIVAGDRLTVRTKVVDVQERTGASGPVDVLVVEDEARDEKGAPVLKARATYIIRRG